MRAAGIKIVSATLALLGAAWHPAAGAACHISVLELPVKMVGTRAIATVRINGTPVPLTVDTGATFSMLSEAAAAQLNLKTQRLPDGLRFEGLTGRIDARMTTVDHLQLTKGDLPNIDFVVGGNEDGSGAMGLLGRNILGVADVEYDLAHGMIKFVWPNDECKDANMAYWADDTPVSQLALTRSFGEKLPAIRANVLLNGRKTMALFDSGASTLVTLKAARDAGVKPADMTAVGQMIGAGHGKADEWTAPFDTIALGGEEIRHNRLGVGDFDMDDADMLIGIDFFLSHHLYVAKKRDVMFFTYNGGPVFALNTGTHAPVPAGAASGAQEDADALFRRGSASVTRGDVKSALVDLDRAIALEPANAAFLLARARLHVRLDDGAKAAADLDAALRADPASAEARLERAALRVDDDQREPALADLAVLDKALPPQAHQRSAMARLYYQLKAPRESLAQWNLWLPAHPHDVAREEAWNSRCWLRVTLNIELDKALDDCDEAVDADKKNASYFDSRGWVYLRLGKAGKAVSDFDKALKLSPKAAFTLYGRGLAHLALNEAPAAQADFAAARALSADVDQHVREEGLPVAPDAPVVKARP